ncbi:MAG: hypothetical protein ACXVKC_15610, partial [Candidatus Angelobacter sp.]
MRDALVWVGMKIWKRLWTGVVLALIGASILRQGVMAQGAKESLPKSAAEFLKLDASALPISQKIQIGGDADWLAIGFGSVWVTVAKNNEVVR